MWWQVVAAIDERRPDVLFYAPWLRLGGGDILLVRYANAVARLRPDLNVTVVTTFDESTHTEQLADGVQLVDLVTMPGYLALDSEQKRQLRRLDHDAVRTTHGARIQLAGVLRRGRPLSPGSGRQQPDLPLDVRH